MKLVVVFSSLFLLANLAQARPGKCAIAYSQVDRAGYIKQSLYLNLAFPMHPETIRAGLAAYAIANDLSPALLDGKLTDEEWRDANTAMLRSHAAHGVKRVIRIATLKSAVEPFYQSVTTLVNNARKEPQAKAYAETLLTTLRIPRVREISRRYREALGLARTERERKDLGRNFSNEVAREIKSGLISAYPELAASVQDLNGHRLGTPTTRAHLIYRAFADPMF